MAENGNAQRFPEEDVPPYPVPEEIQQANLYPDVGPPNPAPTPWTPPPPSKRDESGDFRLTNRPVAAKEWAAQGLPYYYASGEAGDPYEKRTGPPPEQAGAAKPPGNRPSDGQLSTMDEWGKAREFLVKNKLFEDYRTIDPKLEGERAKQERLRAIYVRDRGIPNLPPNYAELANKEADEYKKQVIHEAEKRQAFAHADEQKAFGLFETDRRQKEARAATEMGLRKIADPSNPNIEEQQKAQRILAKKQEDVLALTRGKTDITQGEGLSSDALKIEGAKFAQTGQMPAMGMGNMKIRNQIINEAAKYWKDKGIDPSTVPALQAEFKGAKETYINMKKSTENFGAFETAMLKNMDYAVNLSSKFPRTQMPPINKVLNAIRTGTGDPSVVEFGTAIYAAAMEFEKIRTAGTNITSAELSIGAQKKAEEILSKASTHQQLQAATKAMKTDASNVMDSRRGALNTLKGEMSSMGIKTENIQTFQQKTIVETRIGKDGKKLFKYSDGTIGKE